MSAKDRPVSKPATQAFRDNYDAIFKTKDEPVVLGKPREGMGRQLTLPKQTETNNEQVG